MVGSAKSTYCRGWEEEGAVPYLVELTDSHLSTFEMLNSMCLLDNYDHLLLTLECRTSSDETIVVPPFDVLLILMTLATVSEHYKEPVLRANDPYNTSRCRLSHRSLKMLRFYTEILKGYGGKCDGQYEIELLRCQFFIIIDSLISNVSFSPTNRLKRQKTASGVVLRETALENEDFESPDFSSDSSSIDNPYRSYMSCLGRKRRILGNELLSKKLKGPGEFINMILWTLSNSLQQDTALYTTAHEIWLPLLEILVDLIVLRHDFYVSHEISKSGDQTLVTQELSESPLATFLHIIDRHQSNAPFWRCLLLSCDYKYDEISKPGELSGDIEVHPVYHEENVLSKTYVSRTTYSKGYKLRKTMSLRRNIVGAYFKLLSEVPGSHQLIRPRPNADQLTEGLSGSLAKFRDIDEFKAFFITGDLSSALYFMPLLAEATLSHLLESFHEDGGNPSLTLIENLDNVNRFLDECTSLFERGFFVPPEKELDNEQLDDIKKGDTCLLVMFQYAIYLNHASAMMKSPNCKKFTTSVYKNDKRRRKVLSRTNAQMSLPNLRPLLLKMLNL